MSRTGPQPRPARAAWLAAALFLSACAGLDLGGPGSDAPTETPAASGEVIGSGDVRVALLLPRSAGGNGGTSARAFRNAAALAMRDFPDAGIQLAVYDSKGTAEGARAAVGTALSEGAEIILGPLFASEVAAAAPQARQAGVPLVAFSSDSGVAASGVYLLSFLPAGDVSRIVAYAAEQERSSFAALLPDNAYGSVAEAAFRRAVAAAGGRIVGIETYKAGDTASMRGKAAEIARIATRADALFMPDAEAAPVLAAALRKGGVTRDRLKFLGSGQWDAPAIRDDPALVGSWFPGPPRARFEDFARRYRAAHGSTPPRNATLAYDATVLAAGLVRRFGAERFDDSVLTSASGFSGLDGVFRFRNGGLTERRLAVYELTGSGTRTVDPAASSFAPAS